MTARRAAKGRIGEEGKKPAKARWMARDCVSLKTPTPKVKGSGDAIHSWNKLQHRQTPTMTRCTRGPGLRPPASLSATS